MCLHLIVRTLVLRWRYTVFPWGCTRKRCTPCFPTILGSLSRNLANHPCSCWCRPYFETRSCIIVWSIPAASNTFCSSLTNLSLWQETCSLITWKMVRYHPLSGPCSSLPPPPYTNLFQSSQGISAHLYKMVGLFLMPWCSPLETAGPPCCPDKHPLRSLQRI